MRKRIHIFDSKILSFEERRKSFQKKLLKLLVCFILSLGFAFVINQFYLFHITAPSEVNLMIQREKLLDQYIELDRTITQIDSVLYSFQHWDDNIYRSVLDLEPIASSIRDVGMGGHNQVKKNNTRKDFELAVKTEQRLENLRSKLQIQVKSYEEIFEVANFKENYYNCKPAIIPISYKDYTYISSYFGYRVDPYYRTVRPHMGLDFPALRGSPVYSTGDGVVKLVKYSRRGYGKEVVIDHGFGFTTRYAHLHRIHVREGQKVLRGTQIGEVGNTGKSTGPHLHYEVRINNTPVNPKYYYNDDLSGEEYEKIVTLANKKQ